MNRILKRPMFKMGGSSGTGITSGLDRQNYRFGTRPNIGQISGPARPRMNLPPVGGGADARRFLPNRMMQMASPMDTNQAIAAAAPTLSTRERLTQALGAGSNRNLGQFLTQFGLNLLSQSPTGNIFQTAATAAQEPTQSLFDQLNREQDLKRQISLEAERLDIGQEQARELQMLKNLDEDSRSAIMKQAEEGFEAGEYSSVNEGVRRLLQTKEFGVADRPGELLQKRIDRLVDVQMSQPGADAREEPIVRNEITTQQNYKTLTENNPNVDFADQFNMFLDIDLETKAIKNTNLTPGKVYYSGVTDEFFVFNGPDAETKFTKVDIKR